MKRRNEDELINLAFGELSSERAGEVEKLLAEEEAAQTVNSFKALRDDLKLLNNIPDSQISIERVREAILAGGLKRKRPVLRWSWVAAPTLALALGWGIMLSRPMPSVRHSSTPEPVQKSDTNLFAYKAPEARNLFHPELELTDLNRAVTRNYSFGKDDPATVAVPDSSVTDSEAVYRPEHSSGYENRAAEEVPTPAVSANEPPVPAVAEKLPNLDDVAMASHSGTDDQGVVVVDEAKDRTTGAQKATEVEAPSDVVVGG
jgi:hypothetical protein